MFLSLFVCLSACLSVCLSLYSFENFKTALKSYVVDQRTNLLAFQLIIFTLVCCCSGYTSQT